MRATTTKSKAAGWAWAGALAGAAVLAAAPAGWTQSAPPAAKAAPDMGPIDPQTGLRRLPYAVNTKPARYAYTGSTLIRHVRLIDGMGGPAKADQDVLVADGRIAQIAPGGTIAHRPGVKIIDGAGLTLLPGLMDLHVHFQGVDRFAGSMMTDPGLRSDVYRYKAQLYGFLYSGVTTVLDCGTVPQVSVGLKRLINNDYVMGPRYFWSGPIIEGGVEPSAPYHLTLPTADKIPATLDYLQSMDVDIVKLYQATSDDLIEKMSRAAHKRGMRVMIDSWARNDVGHMARFDRIDGYPHLNFHFKISDDDARILAEHKDFVFTTFYALNAFSGRVYRDHPGYLDDPLVKDILPPEYLAPMKANPTDPLAPLRDGVYHEVVEPIQDLMGFPPDTPQQTIFDEMSKIGGYNLRKLMDAGVLIAAGTDGGEGESTLTELELIVADGGASPVQAIQMATYNAAKVLKKEKEFGSIQPNLIADLVLVQGDPSTHIRDVRNIQYVFKGGKIIDRASLARQWAY
ncbi:MAG: amidohydrolase family protein [Caulobacteraceae bacterium]|nr:amidohydrolase family protein [Caulobacteraceae bacterium]